MEQHTLPTAHFPPLNTNDMTWQEIKQYLIDSKTAKGCKKSFLSNCVTLFYDKHKKEQYIKERDLLAEKYCAPNTDGQTIFQSYYSQGSGIIQIWIQA